jgi:possible transcriptional regulator
MERRGLQASTRMLSTQWVEVTEEISRYLSVTIDSSVLLVKRLRLAEGEPIGFELAYLAPEVATCLLETMASGGSRKDPHDNCEYTIEHGMMRMEATLMTEADAEAFNHLPTVGAAAFKVTTTSYTSQGSPVEHSVTLYKGDAYFYEMLL